MAATCFPNTRRTPSGGAAAPTGAAGGASAGGSGSHGPSSTTSTCPCANATSAACVSVFTGPRHSKATPGASTSPRGAPVLQGSRRPSREVNSKPSAPCVSTPTHAGHCIPGERTRTGNACRGVGSAANRTSNDGPLTRTGARAPCPTNSSVPPASRSSVARSAASVRPGVNGTCRAPGVGSRPATVESTSGSMPRPRACTR